MKQNETSSATSATQILEFLDHWAWKFYAYLFASLFGIFAATCFAAFVHQCTRSSRSRNIHRRFTTVQLFIAATLKVASLLCNPIVLHNKTVEIIATTLLIDCASVALNLSAFSILLLILLETTKTSLAGPKLQNACVLLAITGVLTTVMVTLNLLSLYSHSKFWYFVSYIYLLVWGILICFGYAVAGHRMWRNLKSSRSRENNTEEGRLKRIITLVFLSPFITAATLILSVCMAASHYGIIVELKITERRKWSKYTILFLLRSCEYTIMVIIFGIVIRTKSRRSSVNDAPSIKLGTFEEDVTIAGENCGK